jgi:hypothetical protein
MQKLLDEHDKPMMVADDEPRASSPPRLLLADQINWNDRNLIGL